MFPSPIDSSARLVLAHYELSPTVVRFLGNHGGFSGARLWRVQAGEASFCLRAWPPDDPAPDRLRRLHALMAAARADTLAFVPAVLPSGGTTFIAHDGRLWELTTWLPGCADFHQRPQPARLRAACVALARLHHTWAAHSAAQGICPALARRLDRAKDWLDLISSGWRPRPDRRDPVGPWVEPAWHLLSLWVRRVAALLAAWADRPFPLHPCLCDVWHDHVLFEGDAVTGIVDYGSVKVDQAAADLARLLGSLVGDDTAAWTVGLDAYASVRPLSLDEQALAQALDRTGVILGAANWLRWLYHDGRSFPDRQLIADRLAGLVRRIETWPV
jgi:Ser/Thr protein kinase RdoA (MazF antagonist)